METGTPDPRSGADESSRLLSAPELAQLLGVPTSWVYEQSRLGRIPTITLGRYRRYRLRAILDWLAQLEEAGMRTVAGRR